MVDPLFYEYYDRIYSVKDYDSEVNIILDICKNRLKDSPKNVLDIGCGTGNHSLRFAEHGCKVTGIDLDEKMIEIAKKKVRSLPENMPSFHCIDVSNISHTCFDLAVSLFNVINYIGDINTLGAFLRSISEKLSTDGLFIFDCWNGLAAILDPPGIKKSTMEVENETIKIETIPDIHLMDQTVDVNNVVIVSKNGQSKTFEYNYSQYLWTPSVINMMLNQNGFNRVDIAQSMRPDIPAGHSTWKIMFICGKI